MARRQQAEWLAQFAKAAAAAQNLPDTLEQTMRHARELIDTDFAGITLLGPGGGLHSAAASHAIVRQADRLQAQLKEGPCVQATTESDAHVLCSQDLRTDPRWPAWGPAAARTGLSAVLSAQLRAGERCVGALSLYTSRPRTFTSDEGAAAHLFAVHAAAALTAAITEEQLRTAVNNRTRIGQAQGMLMERFGLDADHAFDVLRRYSQTINVPIRDIAADMIATRHLPPLDRS